MGMSKGVLCEIRPVANNRSGKGAKAIIHANHKGGEPVKTAKNTTKAKTG